MEKLCCTCKSKKLFSCFTKDRCTKDGYSFRCKDCRKIARRKSYLKNKATIFEKQREKRKKFQQWVRKFKDKCKICGESHPACLDFHHVGKKESGIANMINRNSLTESLKNKIIDEIEKCEVLCSNCHRKLHWEERNLKTK